jgi:hypothetical protein
MSTLRFVHECPASVACDSPKTVNRWMDRKNRTRAGAAQRNLIHKQKRDGEVWLLGAVGEVAGWGSLMGAGFPFGVVRQ